ncbi:MAG TPA: hypothetical protein VE967_03870, partial [Gemmatimonadaceae bacterium]|nr:hypothetical protein [Gemmatimonadaceae bacterium]
MRRPALNPLLDPGRAPRNPWHEVRLRAQLALIVLVPLLFAGVCPGGDSGTNPNGGGNIAISIASGQGDGNGKVAGSGFSCDIVGQLASGTCVKQVAANTQLAVAATPSTGSVFSGWGGACAQATSSTCLITATAAASATAKFDLQPNTLTVAAGGGTGNGTVTGNGINCSISAASQSGTCTVDLPPATNVTLTATPAAGGHTFEGWGGACSGTQATCTTTMAQSRNVTAKFNQPPTFALTVTSGGGTGSGTVT